MVSVPVGPGKSTETGPAGAPAGAVCCAVSVPIAHHHDPAEVKDPALRKLAELVHLAGRCADVFVDEQPAPAIAEVRKLCHES